MRADGRIVGDMNDSNLLSRALHANALYSTLAGATMAVAATALDDWSGVPAWLLVAIGVGLIGFAASLVFGARRPNLIVDVGRTAVAGDLGWIVGAIVVIAATSWLTTEGEVTLAIISIPVAIFAAAQWQGLKNLTVSKTNETRPTDAAATS